MSCTKELSKDSALMAEVKRALSDRDGRLSSYHLVVKISEGSDQGTHAFFFRAPNKMRAVMLSPRQFQWSFDGELLYQLQSETKTFSTFELNLPRDKAATFLHSTFSPFVLEGFRTPLMPMKGVTAARIGHPKAAEAVELTLEPGEGVTVTYVLRWPTADFLERRVRTESGTKQLKIDEEHCDEKSRLCVPKRATETVDGKLFQTILVDTIELNIDVPAAAFAPAVPAGWATERRQLVED